MHAQWSLNQSFGSKSDAFTLYSCLGPRTLHKFISNSTFKIWNLVEQIETFQFSVFIMFYLNAELCRYVIYFDFHSISSLYVESQMNYVQVLFYIFFQFNFFDAEGFHQCVVGACAKRSGSFGSIHEDDSKTIRPWCFKLCIKKIISWVSYKCL